MALFILDTSIVVALARGKALGARVNSDYGLRASMERPVVSIVTIGEMRSLARQFKWGEAKRKALDKILEELLVVDIHSEDVLSAYEEIDADGIAAGRKIGENDTWIAATAKATNRTLLTTDTDFTADHLKRHIAVVWVDPKSH